MASQQAQSPGYVIHPQVEGVQIFRTTGEADALPGFLARCRCGWKSRDLATIEMAELLRDTHDAGCLWPR